VKWLRGRVEIPCALLPQFSLLAFDITERRWAAFAAGDRLAYALMGHGNRYEFYVRRYANTLTWTHKLVIRDPADACHDQLALTACSPLITDRLRIVCLAGAPEAGSERLRI
jgi:hypothetical protein